MTRLLAAAGDVCTVRDRRLIALLAATGMRAAEACGLRVDQVAWHDGVARVGTKGRGARDVVMPRELVLELACEAWCAHVRGAEGYVFGSGRGRCVATSHLRRVLARVGLRAGIRGRVHPHLLRHAYASCVACFEGLESARVALGHADAATTRVYVHRGVWPRGGVVGVVCAALRAWAR